jgi:hypothetical protein
MQEERLVVVHPRAGEAIWQWLHWQDEVGFQLFGEGDRQEHHPYQSLARTH